MALFASFSAYFLLASVLCQVGAGDDDQVKVAAILGEISDLLDPSPGTGRSLAMLPDMPMMMAPRPEYDELMAYSENDIILSSDQAEAILDNLKLEMGVGGTEKRGQRRKPGRPYRWPLPIAYTFDDSHTNADKEIIREGLTWWQDATCVAFEEFPPGVAIVNRPALKFTKQGTICKSHVGRKVNKNMSQPVWLPYQCLQAGIVSHEVGHVLGLFHEHTRPTRDTHIEVKSDKIERHHKPYYAKIADHQDIGSSVGYDHSSLMHYPSVKYSMALEKLRVLVPRNLRQLTTLGQRQTVSFNDAKRINLHYYCAQKSCSDVVLPQPCQHGGYQDPKACSRCRCPPGTWGQFCQQIGADSTQPCGGSIDMTACSVAKLTSPGYPGEPYPAGTTCTWHIKSPGGLVFAFENQPTVKADLRFDSCVDFVEIKTETSNLSLPGSRFCAVGQTSGRVATADGEAVVIFQSSRLAPAGARLSGFKLVVYSTCNGTSPDRLSEECLITSTGYDYQGGRSVPDDSGTCYPWGVQSAFGDLDFPDNSLVHAAAKCRNPHGQASPWCYTNNKYDKIGYCRNISNCRKLLEIGPH